MRTNLPVTGVERILQDNDVIVSKTDAKGLITYINKTFIEISGFTEEELIGSPHNMVRHPDMPPAAFADLWATLQKGKSWKGYVKNRCKNGDHYWVEANANPIWENGQVVGYMSLRTKASRETIEFCENLYRRLREGKARGWTVKQGRPLRTGLFGLWDTVRKPTVRLRLWMLIGLLGLVILGNTTLSLIGMMHTTEGLRTVYADRLVPAAAQIFPIQEMIGQHHAHIIAAMGNPNAEYLRQKRAAFEHNQAEIDRLWKEYMATYLTPEEKVLAEEWQAVRGRLVQEALLPAFAALEAGRVDEAKRIVNGPAEDLFTGVKTGASKLIELQARVGKEVFETAESEFVWTRNLAVLVSLIGIGLALLMGGLLLRAILRPLREVEDLAMAVSSGDLTRRIEVQSDDEIGRVVQAFKNVGGNLRGIVQDVRQGAGNISQAAQEIAAGNDDLSQRTQEQASALEETASSMEEMTSTVKQNADNARQANQLAMGARSQAEKGGEVVTQAVAAMSEINASSRKIADIISVIDEIAFQTNLLALNAAVEAARAGEQGRGFAVVAAEVRNLAQRSAGAAKEIKGLIEDSVDKVRVGSNFVDESGRTLTEIVESVKKVTDIVAEIASASQEQSSGIEQVNKAITQMDEVTQQNAALVEEAAAASRSAEDQGHKLVELMGFFRMGANDSAVFAPAKRTASVTSIAPPSAPDRAKIQAAMQRQQARKHAVSAGGGGDEWEEF